MWDNEVKKIWKEVLKKRNHCICHKDKDQQKIEKVSNHKLLNEKVQKKYFVDECGNPYKINLRDLHKILLEEIDINLNDFFGDVK